VNWIIPVMEIYLAVIMPNGVLDGFDDSVAIESNLRAGVVLFEHVGIEGEVQVYSTLPRYKYLRPYQADFIFDAYAVFGGFQVGYMHECMHQIRGGDESKQYEGAYDKLYIQYKARFD